MFTAPKVSSFVDSTFGRGRNPWPGSLIELVGRFDFEWSEELREFLAADDEYLKRERSALVDKRNKIAHGAGEGITASKSLELVGVARQCAGWFLKKFDPR